MQILRLRDNTYHAICKYGKEIRFLLRGQYMENNCLSCTQCCKGQDDDEIIKETYFAIYHMKLIL